MSHMHGWCAADMSHMHGWCVADMSHMDGWCAADIHTNRRFAAGVRLVCDRDPVGSHTTQTAPQVHVPSRHNTAATVAQWHNTAARVAQ